MITKLFGKNQLAPGAKVLDLDGNLIFTLEKTLVVDVMGFDDVFVYFLYKGEERKTEKKYSQFGP